MTKKGGRLRRRQGKPWTQVNGHVTIANLIASHADALATASSRVTKTSQKKRLRGRLSKPWNQVNGHAVGTESTNLERVRTNFIPRFNYVTWSHVKKIQEPRYVPGGGGTWVFFGWICAGRGSKLAPRSKKISPKTDIPF